MPYKSEAQRRYFHAHRRELTAQGVNVEEWDKATNNKALPERAKNTVHTVKSFEKDKKK